MRLRRTIPSLVSAAALFVCLLGGSLAAGRIPFADADSSYGDTIIDFAPASQAGAQAYTMDAPNYSDSTANMVVGYQEGVGTTLAAAPWAVKGKPLPQTVTLDASKPIYIEYDLVPGGPGGMGFLVGGSEAPDKLVELTPLVNDPGAANPREIAGAPRSGVYQLDIETLKALENSGTVYDPARNVVSISSLYLLASYTYDAAHVVKTLKIHGTAPVQYGDTTVDFLPADEAGIAAYNIDPTGPYNSGSLTVPFDMQMAPDGGVIVQAYEYAAKGMKLPEAVVLDARRPIYLECDVELGQAGGVSFLLGGEDTGRLLYLPPVLEEESVPSGAISANEVLKSTSFIAPVDMEKLAAQENNDVVYDAQAQTLTIRTVYLLSSWNWGGSHHIRSLKIHGFAPADYGDTTVDYIPTDEAGVQDYAIKAPNYSSENGAFGMAALPGGGVAIRGLEWATQGKALAQPITLDTTRPIYLEYHIQPGADGGGVGILIGGEGAPEKLVHLGSLIGGDPASHEVTTALQGVTPIDMAALAQMENSETVYDPENHTLTISSIYLLASWTWTEPHNVYTLKIHGTAANTGEQIEQVEQLIRELPDEWTLATVCRLNAAKAAFDALPASLQEQVSNRAEYEAALAEVNALLETIRQNPTGEGWLRKSLLPVSAQDIEENWTDRGGEGEAKLLYENGQVLLSSNAYRILGKTFDNVTAFRADAAVYLEFDFTIEGNNDAGDTAGGGGLSLAVEGENGSLVKLQGAVAGITVEPLPDLEACNAPDYAWPRHAKGVGNFKGCVKLDPALLAPLLDGGTNSLRIKGVQLSGTWNCNITLRTLNLVGMPFAYDAAAEAAKVDALIAGLPAEWTLSTVNLFNPVRTAYETLEPEAKAKVERIEAYNAASRAVEELLALTKQEPQGDTTLPLLPESTQDIEQNWTLSDGEGNSEFLLQDGRLVVASNGYKTVGRTLTQPVRLRTDRPIYLRYDFTVRSNDYDGGGGFVIFLQATPGGPMLRLSCAVAQIPDSDLLASHAPDFMPPAGVSKEGRFTGCIQLDLNHLRTLTGADALLDENLHVMQIGAVYMGSTWGSVTTLSTLELTGDAYTYNAAAEAARVDELIAGLPAEWTLSTVSLFNETKAAYEALQPEAKALLQREDAYNAANQRVGELLELIRQTPEGDTTVSLIPTSAQDRQDNWTLEKIDDYGTPPSLEYTDGKTILRNGGFSMQGRAFDPAYRLDTNEPIYLEYAFEIKGNQYSGDLAGGGGLSIQIEGVQDGVQVRLNSVIALVPELDLEAYYSPDFVWPRGPENMGRFQGCVRIDPAFFNTLLNSNTVLDGAMNVFTLSKVYLTSTWGSETVVTKLNLVGTAYTYDPQREAARVAGLIDGLPRHITMGNLNRIAAVEAAYNALTDEEKALVENAQALRVAIQNREELLARANMTPSGPVVIDFLPKSEQEIQNEWEPVAGEGEMDISFDEGVVTIRPSQGSNYPGIVKYLPDSYLFDTTKPIYLAYEFTVTGNEWDGGGGIQLQIGDGYLGSARLGGAIVPGIGSNDIVAYYAPVYDYPIGKQKSGTFKGCIAINELLDSMLGYESVYSAELGTLLVGHISLSATWGAVTQLKTLKLYGTPVTEDQNAANQVIELISALPQPIDLTDEVQLVEAVEAYNALTEEQKALVSNYDILHTAYETFRKLAGMDDEEPVTEPTAPSGMQTQPGAPTSGEDSPEDPAGADTGVSAALTTGMAALALGSALSLTVMCRRKRVSRKTPK